MANRRRLPIREILPLRPSTRLSRGQVLSWTVAGAALSAALAFLVTFGLGPTASDPPSSAVQPTNPARPEPEPVQRSETATVAEPVATSSEGDQNQEVASEAMPTPEEASPLPEG